MNGKLLQLHADAARITSISLQRKRLTVMIEAGLKPTLLNLVSSKPASIPASKPNPVPEPSKPEPLKKAGHPPLPLIPPRRHTAFTRAGTLADIVDNPAAYCPKGDRDENQGQDQTLVNYFQQLHPL